MTNSYKIKIQTILLSILIVFSSFSVSFAETQTINLVEGFNFVCLSLDPDSTITSEDILKNNSSISKVFIFDSAQQQFVYILRLSETQIFGTKFDIRPAQGCIIETTQATTLSITGTAHSFPSSFSGVQNFNFIGVSPSIAGNKIKSIFELNSKLKSVFKWNYTNKAFDYYMDLGNGTLFGTNFDIESNTGYFFNLTEAGNLILNLEPKVLSTIAINSAGDKTAITQGATLQLNLKGTNTDNSTLDITTGITWSITTGDSLATIDTNGLVTSKAAGDVTVKAVYEGKEATFNITVNASPLSSIAVTAAENATQFAVFETLQLTATGTYEDKSTTDITSKVKWLVLTGTEYATIAETTGLLSGIEEGKITVNAVLNDPTNGYKTGEISLDVKFIYNNESQINISSTSISIDTGATYDISTLTYEVQYRTGKVYTALYSNFAISIVSGNGTVSDKIFTPNGAGATVIRFSSTMGGVTITKDVTITASPSGEIVIPEIAIADGGIQASPAPSGEVYYFNSAGTAEESDIRMDSSIVKREQTVKRYFHIKGEAVTDDSGYTDRFYHSAQFSVALEDSPGSNTYTDESSFTIPVNSSHKFDGYLYFQKTGKYRIYSFRSPDNILHPFVNPSTAINVGENWSTLVFYVNVTEAVPSNLVHLLPSRNITVGETTIRDYALKLTKNATTDEEKIKAIFEFFVNGDENGKFYYKYYNEIYPGILDSAGWNDTFTSYEFLQTRQGVCNDFAELFAALCRSLGYQVKTVSGDKPDNGGGHAWSLIYLNDQWMKLDATWANNIPSQYKTYAQFYTEFNEATFDQEHSGTYTDNLKTEY